MAAANTNRDGMPDGVSDAAIAFVAQWLVLIPAALVVISIITRKRWRADILEAVIAGIVTVLLVKLGGALHPETRPFLVLHRTPLAAHAPDNSFPSDHLAACGLAVAYLWNRNQALSGIAVVMAVAIGAARVLALLHWPPDIIWGFVFGVVAVAIARLTGAYANRYAAVNGDGSHGTRGTRNRIARSRYTR